MGSKLCNSIYETDDHSLRLTISRSKDYWSSERRHMNSRHAGDRLGMENGDESGDFSPRSQLGHL